MRIKFKGSGDIMTLLDGGRETDDMRDCVCSACGETFSEDKIDYDTVDYEYWGRAESVQYAVSPCCGEAFYTDDDIEYIEGECEDEAI